VLAGAYPEVPVLAEESAEAGRIPALDGAFFCVDPLDGTKSFIDRGRDFAVCVGLVEAGRPVAGVVYGPALDKLYAGMVARTGAGLGPAPAAGAWLWRTRAHRRVDAGVRIAARPVDRASLRAAVSRSHPAKATDAWLNSHQVRARIKLGSALKFGLVAEGGADVYPRIGGQTKEWDNAAGEAVLLAAGGRMVERGGAPPRYGRSGENFQTRAFVAMGAASDAVACALAPDTD
jgi:3'(2'),5'-bisphosphate nucleotidase